MIILIIILNINNSKLFILKNKNNILSPPKNEDKIILFNLEFLFKRIDTNKSNIKSKKKLIIKIKSK